MGTINPKELFRQARELEKSGSKREASAHYARIAIFLRKRGKYEDAKNLIARAILLTPDSPRLHLQRALIELALKKTAAARASMTIFTRRTLRSKKLDSYRKYLEAELKDIPALRIMFYDGCLELDRTDASPFLSLALAYRQAGKLDEARKACLDALKTKTMEKESVALLAEVLAEAGKKEALGHVKRFQKNGMSLADLLLLLSGGAKPGTATDHPYVPAPPEEKGLQDLIKDLESEMGIEIDGGRDSVAPLVREFRRKSDEIISGDSKARIDMGLAFFEMGLVEDARDELREVAQTDPHWLEAQCLVGDIFISQGSDLSALEAFQGVLRDDRVTEEIGSEAKYKLIQIYFRLGDFRQALLTALDLERRAPTYRDLRRLKSQIQDAAGDSAFPEKPAREGTSTGMSRSAQAKKTRKL